MRRWLYLAAAITLIVSLGIVLTGCSKPSNTEIKQAIIAYERGLGVSLTEDDIVIKQVSTRIIPAQATVTFYSVKATIRGVAQGFTVRKNAFGVWEAMQLP